MKPNPEQDADMAAFEKWAEAAQYERGLVEHHIALEAWQAAKADSRAMEDVLEQVCEAADAVVHFCRRLDLLRPDEKRLSEALALAAPYRKTEA